MPPSRRLLVPVLAAFVAGLGVPAAGAQTMPGAEDLPPVSELPQVEEPATEDPAPDPTPAEEPEPAGDPSSERPRADELPNTGSDARVVALLGVTVLLTGVGLRLRTAPEHF